MTGQEPPALAKLPQKPPDFLDKVLDEVAKTEWRRITPLLTEAGIGTVLDVTVTAVYCVAWSDFVHAQRALAESEPVLVTHTGIKYPNPHAKLARQALQQMRALGAELGLSPSSRTRIRITPPPAKTDLERFREKHDA